MLRVFFALNIIFVSLLACKGGYQTCIKKVKYANVFQNQTIQIPISKHKKLIYSNMKPNAEIIKYDPFLNLYLVKDKRSYKHPFRTNYNLPLGYASVDNNMAIEGVIKKNQIGLDRFATFSEVVSTPALLLNSCCALEGIVTPDGIIEKEYINNFINTKKVEYGDIGIRVEDKNNKVIISKVNPFDKTIELKKGDIILELNSQKVTNSAEFMRKILFSPINKKHTIKVLRSAKIIFIETTSRNRDGGGILSDTFLESKGLFFDKNLKIIKLSKQFKMYGLKLNDKLLQVNGKKVRSLSDVRENIDQFKHKALLLFARDDFQFFVNIK